MGDSFRDSRGKRRNADHILDGQGREDVYQHHEGKESGKEWRERMLKIVTHYKNLILGIGVNAVIDDIAFDRTVEQFVEGDGRDGDGRTTFAGVCFALGCISPKARRLKTKKRIT